MGETTNLVLVSSTKSRPPLGCGTLLGKHLALSLSNVYTSACWDEALNFAFTLTLLSRRVRAQVFSEVSNWAHLHLRDSFSYLRTGPHQESPSGPSSSSPDRSVGVPDCKLPSWDRFECGAYCLGGSCRKDQTLAGNVPKRLAVRPKSNQLHVEYERSVTALTRHQRKPNTPPTWRTRWRWPSPGASSAPKTSRCMFRVPRSCRRQAAGFADFVRSTRVRFAGRGTPRMALCRSVSANSHKIEGHVN